jgi:hypothetical protein
VLSLRKMLSSRRQQRVLPSLISLIQGIRG